MCPICQSEAEPKSLSKTTLGGESQYDLVECPNCQTRYLSPMATVEQLEKVYAPQYYGSDWYKQQGWGAAYAKVVLGKRKPGKFLDIGCGLGFFIDGIRKNSEWQVSGVEFSAAAVDFARNKLKLDVRRGELADVNFPAASFDFIQIRNVLEHVRDPMTLLRECRRVLKPEGALHLLVPNGYVDSLNLVNFYRLKNLPAFSKDGHLYFFPKPALLRMFEETGFEIEQSWTYGIRRGLTILGLYPQLFKDWKKHYFPRPEPPQSGEKVEIALPPKKNRPAAYYTYRQIRMNLRRFPGLREYGLDFEILLKPKS